MYSFNCKETGSIYCRSKALAAAIMGVLGQSGQGRVSGMALIVGDDVFTHFHTAVGNDRETVTFFPKKKGGWAPGTEYTGDVQGLALDDAIEEEPEESAKSPEEIASDVLKFKPVKADKSPKSPSKPSH